MATTLLQGRSQVANLTGVKGNADFPDGLLNLYLNLAQKYVQKILNGLGSKQWEQGYDCTANLTTGTYNGKSVKTVTMAQIATGNGHSVSTYPNSIRLIECGDGVSLAASTNFGIAKIADEQFFDQILSDPYLTPTITAPRFMWQDSQLFISPSTVTAAKIHFYMVVKDLVADTDAFEVPDEFIEYVIERAKITVQDRQKLLNNKDEAIKQLELDIKTQFDSFQSSMAEENAKKQAELS